MHFILPEDMTLFEALTHLSPGSSATTLRSWLKEGRVEVDGYVIKTKTHALRKGQKVSLGARNRFLKNDIKIYYEDRHVMVIEKPAGLLSVASPFEKGDTAHQLLKQHFRTRPVYIVHRLDKDTSGVMMFALTEQACEKLKELFEKHQIERAYTAIVEGQMDQDEGTWQSYLYEDDNYVVHSISDPTKGRIAITHYKVVSKSKRYTTLEVHLETGRKNQIRVHCQDAGNPIVGDSKYHATTNPIKRLGLHAHLLAFEHPITQQKMRFESQIPDSFRRIT